MLNNVIFICCTCMTDRFRDVCSCRDTRKCPSTQLCYETNPTSTKLSCHCSSEAVLYQQKLATTLTHISSHDMQPGSGEAAQKTVRVAGTARSSWLKSVCNQIPPPSPPSPPSPLVSDLLSSLLVSSNPPDSLSETVLKLLLSSSSSSSPLCNITLMK